MKYELLDKLREVNPIAFNICNFVTVQDVCNAINSIGASPAAVEANEETKEAEDLIKICGSLTVNLGALIDPKIDQIDTTIGLADKYNKPVILDPVAVGASPSRDQRAIQLLKKHNIRVIRGNAGEIAALIGAQWNAKGIDAGEGDLDPVQIAKDCANQYHCIVAQSGKTDIITDGDNVTKVFNETDLFKLRVGSGDILSSLIGCFCAVSSDFYEATRVATVVYATTGELVANVVNQHQPSVFSATLIDKLNDIDVKIISSNARVQSTDAEE
ncbi:hydroxyethylthiazole kinase [Paucilactobacillus suebicus]|uniref:Hydroxyethylthiazole kinase n=1 Tax=Paucilactobacillus suebicus DSM 5007 = KCTC 3549 TaxID=1423807 RepID=A0A0R1WFP2_9LACO|nr:hydroxyethylthiazole kinase [Paucilactobacillus suebicus]KRM12828.1 hydroxyethylthiazole kinase [Paucilactobacillus suebicus DSM 5007 = KCTC 3549]